MNLFSFILSVPFLKKLLIVHDPVYVAPTCFFIILLLGFILHKFTKKRFRWLTFPVTGVLSLFVALSILIYPLVSMEVKVKPVGAILNTFLIVLSAFTGNFSYDTTLLNSRLLIRLGTSLRAYELWLEIFVLLAEIATITVLLAVLFHYFNYGRYFLNILNKVSIFSRLNEQTIITAKNQKKLYPNTQIVIMDPDETEDKYLLSEAKKLDAIVFKKDIKSFHFGLRLNNTYIILDSSDDSKNIKNFFKLVEKKKFNGLRFSVTDIYLYSSSREYTPIIDSFIKNNEADLEGCYVIVVDEIQNIANDLFFQKPLFQTEGDINLVILGNSAMAETLATTAAWIGQMNTKSLNIYIGSEENHLEERYKVLYPELKTQKNSHNQFKWEYLTEISITEIEKKNPTYIILADKNEDFNISYGISLYSHFSRKNYLNSNEIPEILVWTQTDDIQKPLNSFYKDENAKEPKKIESFGSQKARFQYNNIFNPTYDKLGFAVHLSYYLSYSKLKNTIKEIAQQYYIDKLNSENTQTSPDKGKDRVKNYYRVIHNLDFFPIYREIINTYVLNEMVKEVLSIQSLYNNQLTDKQKDSITEADIKDYLIKKHSNLYLSDEINQKKISRFGRFINYLGLLNPNYGYIEKLKEKEKYKDLKKTERIGFYIDLLRRPARLLHVYDKENNDKEPISFYSGDKPIYSRMKVLESDYYKEEYNRRSSFSAGLHTLYKLYEYEKGSNNKKESNNKEVLMQLNRLEHKRWMYYFYSQGYGKFNVNEFDQFYGEFGNKSQKLKTHINLVDWKNNVSDPLDDLNITYENYLSHQIVEESGKLFILTKDKIKPFILEPHEYDDLDLITLKTWYYQKYKKPIEEEKNETEDKENIPEENSNEEKVNNKEEEEPKESQKPKKEKESYGNSKHKDEVIVNILRSDNLKKLYKLDVQKFFEKSDENKEE